MKKLLLYIIIVLFFSFSVNAETLIQALKETYEKNPKLNAERENLNISSQEIKEAKSEFLPSITISGYVSEEKTKKLTNESGNEVHTKDVDPEQKSVLIEQKIYQGLGGLANYKRNSIGLEIAKLNLKKTEQEILLEAVEAYTGLYSSNQLVKINVSNVSLLERQVETDKNRLENGEISLTDLAQSESSFLGAKAQLIESENNLIISKLNYEKTIGKINGNSEVYQKYIFNFGLPKTLASATSIAKNESPDLNIAILKHKQSELDVKIAQSELSPSAVISYKLTETDDVSTTYDESDKGVFKAEASWPFYSGGKNTANLKKHKSLRNQKLLLLDDAKKNNKTNVANAWSSFQSSKSLLDSVKSQVRAAEIANEGIIHEYDLGNNRSTLDVIQSNSILLDSKIDLIHAERNFIISQFNLLASIGRLTASNLGLK